MEIDITDAEFVEIKHWVLVEIKGGMYDGNIKIYGPFDSYREAMQYSYDFQIFGAAIPLRKGSIN